MASERALGSNERRVRDAIEACAVRYGEQWVISWQVARVAGVTRRAARYWLEQLEREGVVTQRPTTRRVADDRDHDPREWRVVDVGTAAE